MNGKLIVPQGSDAARRELCRRAGRGCHWNWSAPEVGGTPGQNILTQEAWCQTCGRERTTTLSVKIHPTEIQP